MFDDLVFVRDRASASAQTFLTIAAGFTKTADEIGLDIRAARSVAQVRAARQSDTYLDFSSGNATVAHLDAQERQALDLAK
jgi:hypothetical protein